MPEPRTVTACVIIIGNEILSGRTQDANLPYLAKALNGVGIRVMEARVVRDEERAIVEAVDACRAPSTTSSPPAASARPTTTSPPAASPGLSASRWCRSARGGAADPPLRPADLNEARLKMAEVPEGASLIDNPVSSAPGFRIGNVFVLPGRAEHPAGDGRRAGVELQGGEPVLSRTVSAFAAESAIAAPLAAVQERIRHVEIGSYPFVRSGRFGTSLVVRSPDPAALDAATADVAAMLRTLGIEPIEDGEASAA